MGKISKQVIVVRKDLRNAKGEKIRSGKIAAQVAHASLKALLDDMHYSPNDNGGEDFSLEIDKDSALNDWLKGRFTKICVSVDSEQELLDIYNQAVEKGLMCSLIRDAGLTEFNNVPTLTCCAIGPNWSDEIDEITKDLKLL